MKKLFILLVISLSAVMIACGKETLPIDSSMTKLDVVTNVIAFADTDTTKVSIYPTSTPAVTPTPTNLPIPTTAPEVEYGKVKSGLLTLDNLRSAYLNGNTNIENYSNVVVSLAGVDIIPGITAFGEIAHLVSYENPYAMIEDKDKVYIVSDCYDYDMIYYLNIGEEKKRITLSLIAPAQNSAVQICDAIVRGISFKANEVYPVLSVNGNSFGSDINIDYLEQATGLSVDESSLSYAPVRCNEHLGVELHCYTTPSDAGEDTILSLSFAGGVGYSYVSDVNSEITIEEHAIKHLNECFIGNTHVYSGMVVKELLDDSHIFIDTLNDISEVTEGYGHAFYYYDGNPTASIQFSFHGLKNNLSEAVINYITVRDITSVDSESNIFRDNIEVFNGISYGMNKQEVIGAWSKLTQDYPSMYYIDIYEEDNFALLSKSIDKALGLTDIIGIQWDKESGAINAVSMY